MELEWWVMDQDNSKPQAGGVGLLAAATNQRKGSDCCCQRQDKEIKISYTAALLLADGVWICMELRIDPRSSRT